MVKRKVIVGIALLLRRKTNHQHKFHLRKRRNYLKNWSSPGNKDKDKHELASFTFHAKETNQSSSSAGDKQFTPPNYELVTNVDHIISCSDQDVLNRHLATHAHFHDGVVQLSEAELHAANKLIAIMGLMGLLGQVGPALVLVKPLHEQWKQIIEAGWNNTEEEENETEHDDNNMEEKM